MTGRTVSIFATVQVELDVPVADLQRLGERAAIEYAIECDSVEVLSVDDLRCNECGSSTPYHCPCVDAVSDDEDARELDQAERARDAA